MVNTVSDSVKAWINDVSRLWDQHLVEFFDKLLEWYRSMNKDVIEGIILSKEDQNARNNAYEYVYTYWALLKKYNFLKEQLEQVKKDSGLKDVMLWQRDEKIDWMTKTYSEELDKITKELDTYKQRLEAIDKAKKTFDKALQLENSWDFDVARLDEMKLEDRYLSGVNSFSSDLDSFLKPEFIGGLIDQLNLIWNLKLSYTWNSIDEVNLIDEIWKNFFELIIAYGWLKKAYDDNIYVQSWLTKQINDFMDKVTEKEEQVKKVKNNSGKKETKLSWDLDKLTEDYEVIKDEFYDLMQKFEALDKEHKEFRTEYTKMDYDNAKLHKELKDQKAKIEEYDKLLWLKPSQIEWILNHLRTDKKMTKAVIEGSTLIWKTVWIYSQQNHELEREAAALRVKWKQKDRKITQLETDLEKSEREKNEMQKKLDELQKLVNDHNIQKTKDWYTPISVKA